jgi:O-glycosyl hydrolase
VNLRRSSWILVAMLCFASAKLHGGRVQRLTRLRTFGLGSLQSVAIGNPDGSLVLIVLNTGSAATTFNVGWRKKYATYRLDPNAVATFRSPPARVH